MNIYFEKNILAILVSDGGLWVPLICQPVILDNPPTGCFDRMFAQCVLTKCVLSCHWKLIMSV